MTSPRHNWTVDEIAALYDQPFLDLIYEAQTVHRQHFKAGEIQKSTLLSIKTGACSEDCGYCPQSARYKTAVEREPLLDLQTVLEKAHEAKESGSSRFCMGAAWREVKDGPDFDRVVEMVNGVSKMGMEVCCTLGMINTTQAKRLKEAGLTAYNHNLDTSPEYYGDIITTRTYEDRLNTISNLREAGVQLCCGGIVGLGESKQDRFRLLQMLANQNPHPESVPINKLVAVPGTPLSDQKEIEILEFIRTIATARILMPQSFVRLSAGRTELSDEAQALAFMAGANSIFAGDKLLTTPNPEWNADQVLFNKLGLKELPISPSN
ncbi:MAG: biotin synthase BioB [Deltaproteobacteria bacterium]|nr:MAG: biotin synthase BioB [Deltaproteobacteria bacterium]